MYRKLFYLISFVLVLATGGAAQAGLNDPPLLNKSFEEETSWGQPTPGWYDYDAESEEYWAFQETRDDDPKTTYGDVWGALRPGGIHWQKIGTWDPDAVYQIDVLLGNRTTWTNSGIYISLWGGGNEALASDDTYPEAIGATKLSESDLLITDEVGSIMETKEVSTILSTGIGLTLGDPLWIQIESGNRVVGDGAISYFDYPRIKLVKNASDADDPNPTHWATDMPRNVVISWKPGIYADKHDVYLGTNFDDVNDASRANPLSVLASQNQDPNIYAPPERLVFGESYYWRIDEVNAAPDYTVFKGKVWQFTVEPVAYPIPAERITVTASSQSENQGPENTVNGSGLDVNDLDLHSNEVTAMWLSDAAGPQPTWIQYEFDKVYKLHEMWVWNHNGLMEQMIGVGFKDVSIEYSVNGTDYTTLGTTHEFAQGTAAADYEHNTTVDFGGESAKFIRLTANSNWVGFLPQYGLSEVRFLYIPVQAREPSPDSGATDVAIDAILGFRAGREAAKHDVYLSTDEQAVIDGTASVSTVTEASYSTSLDVDSTYYWRVDEVNDAETPTTWQGDIWSFTTPEYLVVDDFELYNDLDPGDLESNRIFNTWIDGYGTTTNGSLVGYDVAPFAEQFFVHGGEQSMPFSYDNNFKISEADLPISPAQNWAEHGVMVLVLYFHGDPSNTVEQMYLKVNDTKVVYDGDASDIASPWWRQWSIDLVDLASLGVDLQNVTELSIGFGDEANITAGGSGVVFFDNIGLYRSAPVVAVGTVSLIEDFDSLVVGSNMHDVNGWEGWWGDAQWGARVTDAVAYSGTNSLEIVGARDDLVPNWPVVDSGVYVLTVMQYVPATTTAGEMNFGPLSSYGPSWDEMGWLGTILTNCDTEKVYVSELDAGTRVEADLVRDQWVELKTVMDFYPNVCSFYYNDVLLGTRECPSSQGVDIWPNDNIDAVYYDDFRFEPAL